jgi:hypothetical protein
MRDLFKYAIKRKLLVVNPAVEIEKRASGNPDGHHTWTPEQVEQFRRKHPIGSKARLALELINALAFRRSDVIRVGPPDVCNGVLKYTQWKMREHSPSTVEVPMPSDLNAVIRATPGTGIKTWLVDGHGKPFTEAAFSHWFADRCDEAGPLRSMRATITVLLGDASAVKVPRCAGAPSPSTTRCSAATATSSPRRSGAASIPRSSRTSPRARCCGSASSAAST